MLNRLKMLQALIFFVGLVGGSLAAGSQTQATAPAVKKASVSPYNSHRAVSKRARVFYTLAWGVENLSVKSVESGELIRFSYGVIDPEKAAQLNDKNVEPALYCERSRVKLVIPSLEKVGQLRNKGTPEAGKSYWMAFSNKGRYVRKGDRVSVVIGNFRASGLVVK
jgi:hypothetical protein